MNPRTYKSFILFHNKTKTKCSWIWWLVVDMPTTFFGHENQNNFFFLWFTEIILKIYVKIKILLNLLNYKMTQWMMKCHKSNMKMKLVDVTKMNTLWFCADRKKNYSIWMNWERIKGFMVNPINRFVLEQGVRQKVANRQNVFFVYGWKLNFGLILDTFGQFLMKNLERIHPVNKSSRTYIRTHFIRIKFFNNFFKKNYPKCTQTSFRSEIPKKYPSVYHL